MKLSKDSIQVPTVIPKDINKLLLEDSELENNSRSAIIAKILINYYKGLGKYPKDDNK